MVLAIAILSAALPKSYRYFRRPLPRVHLGHSHPKSPCLEYRFYTILPPSISNRFLPERHS